MIKTQAYELDIECMTGKKNVVVDAFSRKLTLCFLYIISVDWKGYILAEYAKTTFAAKISDQVVKFVTYIELDGQILYKNQVFLVIESKMEENILRAIHDCSVLNLHPCIYALWH